MGTSRNLEFDTLSAWEARQHWLTGHAAREQAAKRGCQVEYSQFGRWLDWGLLPDPIDGRFPPMVVDRLVRIVEIGREKTALERRVLVLGGEFRDPAVPDAQIRLAMETLVLKIPAKARLLRTVHELFAVLGGEAQALPPRKRKWTPPAASDEWLRIIREINPLHFTSRRQGWYIWALMLRTHFPERLPSSVPDEELFTAVVVRDSVLRGEPTG